MSKSNSTKKLRTDYFSNSTDKLGSGDSYYVENFLNKEDTDRLYKMLLEEIKWGSFSIKGSPVPRLITVQADVSDDGTHPLYRHPVDEHPPVISWCTTAAELKKLAEAYTGEKLNHALIQLYRDGKDFISPHSDKTLDIAHGSMIVNISLGETRTLVLKSKTKPINQEIKLAHGSLYVLGWKTNIQFLHGIRRNADPRAVLGQRISLTMRNIATFLTPDGKLYGQGAVCKTREDLDRMMDVDVDVNTSMSISNKEKAASSMLQLFSQMNKSTDEDIFCPKVGYDCLTHTVD